MGIESKKQNHFKNLKLWYLLFALFFVFSVSFLLGCNGHECLPCPYCPCPICAEPSYPELTKEEIFNRSIKSIAAITSGNEAGTGFLVEKTETDLFMLTSYHVVRAFVAGNNDIHVRFYGTKECETPEVFLAAYDRYHDIAILRITKEGNDFLEGRTPLNLLRNSNIGAAAPLLAIGNMANWGLSSFTGSMSYTGRILELDTAFLDGIFRPVYQVSVNLNAGVSGGPIFAFCGRVIAKAAYQDLTMQNGRPIVGVSFAIPSRILYPLVKKGITLNHGQQIPRTASMVSQNRMVTGLGFALQKNQNEFTAVEIFNRPSNLEGTWLQSGDIIKSIGTANNQMILSDMTWNEIFALLYSFVPRLGALSELASSYPMQIHFERNGVSMQMTFTNRMKMTEVR
ncbi:MAG: serine protease [Firmicutes bacterium]|nr:serine protease [Bacillota bacterium]